jgi:hypothetical protein
LPQPARGVSLLAGCFWRGVGAPRPAALAVLGWATAAALGPAPTDQALARAAAVSKEERLAEAPASSPVSSARSGSVALALAR